MVFNHIPLVLPEILFIKHMMFGNFFGATFYILVGHFGALKPLNPLQRGLQEHDPVLDDLRVLEVSVPLFRDLLPSRRLDGDEEDQSHPSMLFCHQFTPTNAS